jgi:hypothetical protein
MKKAIRPARPPAEARGRLLLERLDDGRLAARLGDDVRVVHVRRSFPWSEPDRYLSLRDEEGKEFALVRDPHELSEASRLVLEQALREAGFLFDITRVADIEEEVELRHWSVSTQQGARCFQTRLDDWPRRLPDGGLLIRDVTGDLYRVADARTLDRRSRALLWAFIDD